MEGKREFLFYLLMIRRISPLYLYSGIFVLFLTLFALSFYIFLFPSEKPLPDPLQDEIKFAIENKDKGRTEILLSTYEKRNGRDDFYYLCLLILEKPGVLSELEPEHTNSVLYLVVKEKDPFSKIRIIISFLEMGLFSRSLAEVSVRAFLRIKENPPESFSRLLRKKRPEFYPFFLTYLRAYRKDASSLGPLRKFLSRKEYRFLSAYRLMIKGEVERAYQLVPESRSWRSPRVLKSILALELGKPLHFKDYDVLPEVLSYYYARGKRRIDWVMRKEILPYLNDETIKRLLPLLCVYHARNLIAALYDQKVLKIPELALAYGYVLEKEGFIKEAYKYYRYYERLRSDVKVYGALSRTSLKLGRLKESLSWLKKGNVDPEDNLFLNILALAFLRNQHTPVWKFFELLPPWKRDWMKAEWTFRREKWDLSRRIYRRLVNQRKNPRDQGFFYIRLADIAYKKKDYDSMRQYLEKVNSPSLRGSLSYAYKKTLALWKSRGGDEALNYVLGHVRGMKIPGLRLKAWKQDELPLLNVIGILYAEKGEEKKAQEYFQKCLMVDPSHKKARMNLSLLRK